MKEELISFVTDKLAKEKGCSMNAFSRMYNQDGVFSSPYKKTYPAYTQSLLQKWLREVHKIQVYAHSNTKRGDTYYIKEYGWLRNFKGFVQLRTEIGG